MLWRVVTPFPDGGHGVFPVSRTRPRPSPVVQFGSSRSKKCRSQTFLTGLTRIRSATYAPRERGGRLPGGFRGRLGNILDIKQSSNQLRCPIVPISWREGRACRENNKHGFNYLGEAGEIPSGASKLLPNRRRFSQINARWRARSLRGRGRPSPGNGGAVLHKRQTLGGGSRAKEVPPGPDDPGGTQVLVAPPPFSEGRVRRVCARSRRSSARAPSP